MTDPETKLFLETFVTPTTVDEAFRFGRQSAVHGHRLFRWKIFFSKVPAGEKIKWPTSIYSAYRKGHKIGAAKRQEKVERP